MLAPGQPTTPSSESGHYAFRGPETERDTHSLAPQSQESPRPWSPLFLLCPFRGQPRQGPASPQLGSVLPGRVCPWAGARPDSEQGWGLELAGPAVTRQRAPKLTQTPLGPPPSPPQPPSSTVLTTSPLLPSCPPGAFCQARGWGWGEVSRAAGTRHRELKILPPGHGSSSPWRPRGAQCLQRGLTGTRDPDIQVNRCGRGTPAFLPSSPSPASEWLLQPHLPPVTCHLDGAQPHLHSCPPSLPGSSHKQLPLQESLPPQLSRLPSRYALFPVWAPTWVRPPISPLWSAAPHFYLESSSEAGTEKAQTWALCPRGTASPRGPFR